jgi:hypothetical protein
MRAASPSGSICKGCGAPVASVRCEKCGVPLEAGGFRIVRVLAQTPHSRVYLAEKDRQQVALKELLFALVPEARDLDAFEREARLLRQLSHPRIPRFVASFREGEGAQLRLYLAQEFVPGGSLLEELQRRRFNEADAKQIAREALAILAFLHGLSPRIIHRDLKPANLMRAGDGHLMLVDFGAARDLARGATRGATVAGTFGYMPPEQLGGTVDETSDLYALGATLVHLLSRRSPDELVKGDLGLDFSGQLNVSPAMEAFLERLVARDRSGRFPNAQAALAALDAPPVRAIPARRVAVLAGAGGAAALAIFAFFSRPAPVQSRVEVPAPSPPRVDPPALSAAAPAPPAVPRPKPKHAKPAKPPPGVDVAEVIEMPHSARKGPPLLRDDVTIAVGRAVEAPAQGCDAPLLVQIERASLQAEGPGDLADPRSLLEVEMKVTNQGGSASSCESATLELRSPAGARVSEEERVENSRPKTVARRRVSFNFPRTLQAVELCVGGTCAGTLDLRGGTWRSR